MFIVGDLVTVHHKGTTFYGYVVQILSKKYVRVRWHNYDHNKPLMYNIKLLTKVS